MQEEIGFDVGVDFREDLETKDLSQRLVALIETLPDKYREVLVMRHVDGLSVKEIARVTGETENVVSVRIHRAIEKTKTLYEKFA